MSGIEFFSCWRLLSQVSIHFLCN